MSEQQEKKPAISIGRQIKKGRDAKGLTQVELADKLKLSVKVIESIEAEDFKELPASTFVKGYIRSIAIACDLNAEALIEEYSRHIEDAEPLLSSTSLAGKQKQSSDPLMIWGTVALVIIVLVLLGVWAVSSLSEDKAPAMAQEPSVTQELTIDETLPDIELINSPVAPQSETSLSLPATEETDELEVPEDADSESPAVIHHDAKKGDAVLTLTVSGPSWADVKDANGFQHVYGLLDADDRAIKLKGQPPFSVFLGDATQVSLAYKGSYFDHTPYIRSNKVAKFSVK